MKILYAASEALPFAASGGLADVVGSLPTAVAQEGHDCRVVLPLYRCVKPEYTDVLNRYHSRCSMEKTVLRNLYQKSRQCAILLIG